MIDKDAMYQVKGSDLIAFANYMIERREEVKESNDDFLSMNEVCKILKTTRATLYRWHEMKYLCFHKVGISSVYLREDVMGLIKQ